MQWSDIAVLALSSSVVGVAVKEIFDIIRGRTRAFRELNKWRVWGWSLLTSLAKDGVDMSKYPSPPEEM